MFESAENCNFCFPAQRTTRVQKSRARNTFRRRVRICSVLLLHPCNWSTKSHPSKCINERPSRTVVNASDNFQQLFSSNGTCREPKKNGHLSGFWTSLVYYFKLFYSITYLLAIKKIYKNNSQNFLWTCMWRTTRRTRFYIWNWVEFHFLHRKKLFARWIEVPFIFINTFFYWGILHVIYLTKKKSS